MFIAFCALIDAADPDCPLETKLFSVLTLSLKDIILNMNLDSSTEPGRDGQLSGKSPLHVF